jgi:hypothetical protein
MTPRVVLSILAASALLAASAHAQSAPPAAPKPCSGPEFRQFDFWVGDWDVQTPDGKLAGTNSITSEFAGCVVHEHWRGEGGMTGESFNHYAPGARRWYQTWVDDQGGFLVLDGSFVRDTMRLTGRTPTVRGDTISHVISFTRIDGNPDRVHQLWQTSKDGGKTWAVAFDGIYVRKGK